MKSKVVGIFRHAHSALAAAGELKQSGFPRPELMSPIPIEGVDDVLGENKSLIKPFTFFGGILGGVLGFLLAAGTAVMYLHPTGGRPIITIPPFLIITYEMTILFGILATVIGFFISARLPAMRERAYLPETAIDKFSVLVSCDSHKHFTHAVKLLNEAGAEEVREFFEGADGSSVEGSADTKVEDV